MPLPPNALRTAATTLAHRPRRHRRYSRRGRRHGGDDVPRRRRQSVPAGSGPTAQSIAAPTGPFATASVSVAAQSNGFGGGVIYYPTDTSQGTFGAIAISPGLNGTWPGIAWLGPRLASQGFVVFGIETNSHSTTAPPAARPSCWPRWTT